MTTVSELVQASGRKIGVTNMSANEISDAMVALNMMLNEWASKKSGVYKVTRENFNITDGTASYTIGSSGDVNSGWPVRIVKSFIRVSNIDYPVTEINEEEYADLSQKSLESRPVHVYLERSYPLASLFFWPTPDQTYAVHLWSHKAIASYSNSATTIELPPEYEAAMLWNLAIDMAPEYEREPSAVVAAKASRTLNAIKAVNTIIPGVDTAVIGGLPKGRNFDINGSLYR